MLFVNDSPSYRFPFFCHRKYELFKYNNAWFPRNSKLTKYTACLHRVDTIPYGLKIYIIFQILMTMTYSKVSIYIGITPYKRRNHIRVHECNGKFLNRLRAASFWFGARWLYINSPARCFPRKNITTFSDHSDNCVICRVAIVRIVFKYPN